MIIVIALTGAGILASVLRHIEVDSQSLHKVWISYVRLFDLNAEANVPTWYSSALLLASASLLASIAYVRRESGDAFRIQWTILALVFLGLSIDGAAQVHELVAQAIRACLNTDGFLYFAWVIPAALFLVVFAVLYFSFLMDLPAKTRRLFLVAGGGVRGWSPRTRGRRLLPVYTSW